MFGSYIKTSEYSVKMFTASDSVGTVLFIIFP